MSQPTYNIVAGDGQTYGPNPLETIQAWITEGRIARDSQMSRSDVEGWFKAGDFQEFTWPAAAQAAAVPVVSAQPVAVQSHHRPRLEEFDPGLVATMKSHANWFWIIAIIGGILDLVAAGRTEVDKGFMFMLALVMNVPFAIAGFFAYRAHRWAFVLGLLLLLGSALFNLLASNWIAVAFRCWAIYEVFLGFRIACAIRKQMSGG